MNLIRVYDATLLSKTATYQIHGCLYRYTGQDPYSTIQAPKYEFSPLPNQRRKAPIGLTHRGLMTKVSLVEGMFCKDAPTADKSVQLGLF